MNVKQIYFLIKLKKTIRGVKSSGRVEYTLLTNY
jgi:hypothetical protein